MKHFSSFNWQAKVLLLYNYPRQFNSTWSLTFRSGSTVRVHKAGKILSALSFKLKYSAEAKKPITPAIRAGGKGSRKARKNAGISTFCRVWKLKSWNSPSWHYHSHYTIHMWHKNAVVLPETSTRFLVMYASHPSDLKASMRLLQGES